jgi:acetyl-CoA C-acetyltransferase
MRDVAIIGIGQTKVGEHWEKDLRHLSLEALQAAMWTPGWSMWTRSTWATCSAAN